ncbi:NAD-dependent epimerase/dehydratase family protein [Brytella acorum]|uniref:GDP-mannose 4,6-dehydratase n=1 Tax=Brytella acorum TaxID=2959299 RepID=A0AA35UTK7_9PROT|nr:NAD-dependent epimerase/dehydratase family protein [Brytella acorum]MDF3625941.1 GDP-mannose 4,6-dehydratase [Brytella acorum]CAI9121836.1 GDP-mannose 4,6-dehydratase [Brytella acorum]
MKILVTGIAGFIGSYVAEFFLNERCAVIGIDNLNSYYDPALKRARLSRLEGRAGCTFVEGDISDRTVMAELVSRHPDITHVVHLAAQAGVRQSLIDPYAYVNANVMGHVTLLEAVRQLKSLEHIVYASSSSVYGLNTSLPFREDDEVDSPGSLYAVTKRANELTARAYAHLYGLPQTGLRFFTAYGPWGRPDMAYYAFARAIMTGQPLTLYAGAGLARDFTYIDDIVRGVVGVVTHAPASGTRLLNLGGDHPAPVRRLVSLLEEKLGREAMIVEKERPLSDVEATWASIEAIETLTGWKPRISLEAGIDRFVVWFLGYEGV